MTFLEKIYFQQLRFSQKKLIKSEEYITYMTARKEFSSKLSEELLIEFEKLMDLKIDCEDVEGLELFKGGIGIGVNMAFHLQEAK